MDALRYEAKADLSGHIQSGFFVFKRSNMASPQKENGYTPISNELLEAFLKYRFPPNTEAPRLIWFFIARKTYGYSKKEDFIPLSQFQEGTGLPRKTVVYWLRYMVTALLLVKGIELCKNGYTYRINKDYDTWKPLGTPLLLVTGKSRTSYTAVTKTSYSPVTLINKKQLSKERDFSEFAFLEDIPFKDAWDSYLETRKKKKTTEHAKELLLKKLHEYDLPTAIAMLEQSTMNGWVGIFPLREDPKNKFKNHNQIVLEKIQKLMVPTMAGKVPGKRYIMDWKYEDTDLLYISDSLNAIEQDNGGIVIERDVRIANDPKFLKTLDQWLYDYTRNS